MTPARANGGTSSHEIRAATHYVLGGAHLGTAVAERLQAAGHRVAIVDESYESSDVPGFAGDPAIPDVLAASGVADADVVVVAARSDRRSLLIAQLVRARFDVPRVVALVDKPERTSLFADAGHEPLCVTSAVSAAVGESV
ncbi:NAD-binding protein [Halogeometricum limi]|uniref:TrkA-N domain-containing protein n=1 Tax=Halogeometricum limi TaxID=555875 RepID=A0A1I6HAL8_9EURY|nr:NAD-binding protein [Halogeometricum limi]SFR51529.1 TrkA-N domain-containing protein [Halogeometricum limi]